MNSQAQAQARASAEREAAVGRLQAKLRERYVIKRAPVTVGDVTLGRTEYRFRGDTSRVAFTESNFRLATDTNSPSVARSMVDVAQARQWRALRVSGSEDFRRLVWLEASVRGVQTLGYEPIPEDLEVLRRQREARSANRIEPVPGRDWGSSRTSSADTTDKPVSRAGTPAQTPSQTTPNSGGSTAVPAAAQTAAAKTSARGGSRKAVLAAIEAVLIAQRLPQARRVAVMAAATEQLAQRLRDGQVPRVKVYDRTAPSQRPVVAPAPDVQRARERVTPEQSR